MMERARHQTIVPFTRFLAGPAEYTTMVFTERRRDSSVAHQIATPAVFHAPLLTYGAHPRNILDNPAVEMIKSIPSTWDQTIVPFTRFLAGPAEYTTMVFTERRRDTSVAHQIASLAVFASPLLTIAANPQSILTSPAVVVIKSIPAVWDETIVLPMSEIGELAVYARRTGTTWFLAIMNGPAAKTIRVPLTFLGAGQYRATFVRDEGPDGATVTVQTGTESRTGAMSFELRPGGGFVGRFVAGK